MAALNLSGMDVVAAIAQQNVQVAAGQIGQPPTMRAQQFQLTINTQGRLTDPKQFADIIVKAGRNVAGQPAQMAATAPSGASGQLGVAVQATPIVKLRDVVRENKYYVRIQLDPAKLASRELEPAEVVTALRPPPHSITADPDAKTTDGQTLTWLATYGGAQPPHVEDVAGSSIAVGHSDFWVRLGDLVVKNRGIEHLQTKDEEGVQLGSQQYDQSCTLNGQPSVALSIYQLPDSNALETANGVYAK